MRNIISNILIVLFLTIAYSDASAQTDVPNIAVQKTYQDQNLIGFSAGWDFYSPSNKIVTAYSTVIIWGEHLSQPDYGTYGGLGMSFRALFAIKNSPIKLGGEIGAFTMRTESESTGLVYVETGDPYTTEDFLNGNNIQLLADLFLFNVGKIVVHTEFGIGLLILWDTTMGFGKAPFEPATEFMSSVKFVFSIPIKEKYMIDPQFIFTKGFSDNDITVYHLYLGFSILL